MKGEKKEETAAGRGSTSSAEDSKTTGMGDSVGGSEQPLGRERIVQRRIVYYSDFEIDLNDWKSEDERIQIFADTIKKALSTSHERSSS